MTKNMRPKSFICPIILLALAILLAACGSSKAAPTPTTSPSAAPDLCSPKYLPAAVQGVHSVMREFDDASALASNTPREQLFPAVSELQRIRREAEDLRVPPCLSALKQAQLTHMNTVIQTLMAFIGGADQTTVTQGIALARQQHDQYIIEMARVLGMTIVPNATPLILNQTPAPTTPLANETSTQVSLSVTNPGPANAILRALPALDANAIGLLEVGQTVQALAQSSDGAWILVEFPGKAGQTAWVYASLVKLSGPPATLPIVTPTP